MCVFYYEIYEFSICIEAESGEYQTIYTNVIIY